MRALLGAGMVLCLAVAMLARAEPPPAMETRELASVRFYAEV